MLLTTLRDVLAHAIEQIVGRERRERVSQLAWCGEGCFDSRRRVNSTVMRLILSILKRPLVIAFAVVVLGFGILVAVNWRIALMFLPPRMGAIAETWETSNGSFKIRVDRHFEENGGFVAGAYYVFRSSPTGSDAWRDIMTFRHDDPNPIPRDQVR